MKKQYKMSLLLMLAAGLIFMCVSSFGLEQKAPWVLTLAAVAFWGIILRLLFPMTRDADIKPGVRKCLQVLFWFLCYCACSMVAGSAALCFLR